MTYPKKHSIINKKANAVLKKYKCKEAPIHVEDIAHQMGVDIMRSDLEDDLSGFLVIKDKKKTIVVNGNHHPRRQRFTIAHEIGHLALHIKDDEDSLFMEKKKVYNRNLKSSTGVDPKEIEANRFAASLLLPEELLNKYIKEASSHFEESGDDNNLIVSLARKFNVSQTAVTHRLSSLLTR